MDARIPASETIIDTTQLIFDVLIDGGIVVAGTWLGFNGKEYARNVENNVTKHEIKHQFSEFSSAMSALLMTKTTVASSLFVLRYWD